MWSWLSSSIGGGSGPAKAEAQQQQPTAQIGGSASGHAGAAAASSTALVPHAPAATASNPSPTIVAAAASSSSSAQSPPATSPSTAVAVDGGAFWGHTTNEFTSEHDPALDDMLAFYSFSHRRHSDYTGAVCFKLKYPDGGMCVRTVQVLPLDEQRMREEEAAEDEAQERRDSASHAVVVRRPARVRYYPRLPAPSAVSAGSSINPASPAPSTALVPLSQQLVPACMPSACVSLTLSARPCATVTAVAAAPAAPSLAIPRSSRVKVYRGEVPAGVSLSATLACPRSVFFDVYMGKLDPIKVCHARAARPDLCATLCC